jgi:Tfp pilus assembly PilM family ATPase
MARPQGICGLELGKHLLAIVHYLPESNSITAVGTLRLDDSPADWWDANRDNLKQLLRDVRANGRRLAGLPVYCSLPAEHAVVTRVLVDGGEEEPAESLRWELSSQVVGTLDEYAFDFQKLPSTRQATVEAYLAAACRASSVSEVRRLVRAHGLKLGAVDLDVLALINVFEANYRDCTGAPALLVLCGNEYAKVVLTWNGQLVDFENTKLGADPEEPDAYVSALRASMDRVVGGHQSLSGRGPVPAYVTGPVFAWPQFGQQCLDALNGAQVLNPFRSVQCESLDERTQRSNAPYLAVAVGLAVRGAAEQSP